MSNAVKKLTSLGDKEVKVVRKYRKHGNKAKWWFLLKSDEEVLVDLENQWDSIELQTKWKLELCFKPASSLDVEENNQLQPPNSTDQEKVTQPPANEIGGECTNSNLTDTTAKPANASSDAQVPASNTA